MTRVLYTIIAIMIMMGIAGALLIGEPPKRKIQDRLSSEPAGRIEHAGNWFLITRFVERR